MLRKLNLPSLPELELFEALYPAEYMINHIALAYQNTVNKLVFEGLRLNGVEVYTLEDLKEKVTREEIVLTSQVSVGNFYRLYSLNGKPFLKIWEESTPVVDSELSYGVRLEMKYKFINITN